MATAKEMGFRPGDIAVFVTAEVDMPGGGVKGAQIDEPDARITWHTGKVEAVGVPSKDAPYGLYTRLKIVRTNEKGSREWVWTPGTTHEVIDWFTGYIGEGDEKEREQMERAGIALQGEIYPDGRKDLRVVRVPPQPLGSEAKQSPFHR